MTTENTCNCDCNCDKTKKEYPRKPNFSLLRRETLKKNLKKYDLKDLRFAYFKSKRAPGIYITAVSFLNRDKCTLTVAFSFSSPRDSFCKIDGKNKCFERLETDNHPYKVTVPWLEDGLLCIYLAYNRLEQKPEKLANSKFDDLIFANQPRSIVLYNG